MGACGDDMGEVGGDIGGDECDNGDSDGDDVGCCVEVMTLIWVISPLEVERTWLLLSQAVNVEDVDVGDDIGACLVLSPATTISTEICGATLQHDGFACVVLGWWCC